MSRPRDSIPIIQAPRHFRVDPRLVHATIVNVWVPTAGLQILILADQKVFDDPKRRAILEMSAMGSVEVHFTPEAEAAAELERCDPSAPVMVLFSSLEAVERAVDGGLKITRLNVGHIPEAAGREPVHPAVHLGPTEYQQIEALQARGIEVVIQPLPHDKATRVPRQKAAPAPEPVAPRPSSRISEKIPVVNPKGLHLRAAHVLAQLVGNLPCEVQIGNDGAMVNAKSLLGLTTLGATCGTLLDVTVEGPDAAASMTKIRELFAGGFGEGVDPTIRPPKKRKGEA